MRGWLIFGPSLAVGLVGNYWCHRTGRPTVCSDTRRIVPAGLFCAALSAGGAVLVDHLYGSES